MKKLLNILTLLYGLAYSQNIQHCNSYIINREEQLQCMRCQIPFYLVDGQCQQCPSGKRLLRNKCVPFEEISYKIPRCIQYYDNDNKKCKKCQPGYKVHANQLSKCVITDPTIFCRLYSRLNRMCLICERGYTLNSEKVCQKKQTADQILYANLKQGQNNNQERSSISAHNNQIESQIIEQLTNRDPLKIIASKLRDENLSQTQQGDAFRLADPLKLPAASFDNNFQQFQEFGQTEKFAINFDGPSFHRQFTITPGLFDQSLLADKPRQDKVKDQLSEAFEGVNLGKRNKKSQKQIIDPLNVFDIFGKEIKEQGTSSPSQKNKKNSGQDQQLDQDQQRDQDQQLSQVRLESSQETNQQTKPTQLVSVVHKYPEFPYCTDFIDGQCFACDQKFVLNLIINKCVLLEQDPRGKAKILRQLQNQQDFCHIRDPETEECSECFRNHYYDKEKQKCLQFNRLCRTVKEENGDCLSCYKDYKLSDGNCQKE